MVQERSLPIGRIGRIHRDFSGFAADGHGTSKANPRFFREIGKRPFNSGMARRGHSQGSGTRFIFVGEQFWGRAARASWTRKSSWAPVLFLGFISVASQSLDFSVFLPAGSSCVRLLAILKSSFASNANIRIWTTMRRLPISWWRW